MSVLVSVSIEKKR